MNNRIWINCINICLDTLCGIVCYIKENFRKGNNHIAWLSMYAHIVVMFRISFDGIFLFESIYVQPCTIVS